MVDEVNVSDIDLVIECLGYYKMHIQHGDYPKTESRRERLERVESVLNKMRALRNELRDDSG